jgi:hypothetical protein
MNCPVCGIPLTIAERQNIEIDYCPQCRGVWLDRGELDKIIERSSQAISPREVEGYGHGLPKQAAPYYPDRKRHGHHDDRHHYEYKKKKHKSLLSELFDF